MVARKVDCLQAEVGEPISVQSGVSFQVDCRAYPLQTIQCRSLVDVSRGWKVRTGSLPKRRRNDLRLTGEDMCCNLCHSLGGVEVDVPATLRW